MKRYIRSTILPEEGEAIAIKEFGSLAPTAGCSFISPDGTFINIYPKLSTHEDLCWYLEEDYNCELEYEDEEYFIREFQWVRLRSDPNMMIIELPEEMPFNRQWDSLQEWLEFCENRYKRGTILYLNVCDGSDADVPYEFGTEYFAEDILKICKRYYSSGKLYASRL